MARFGAIPTGLDIPAGNFVRRNAGDSAFEAASDVVIDGDFASQGIAKRGATPGIYSIMTGSAAVDTVEGTLTDDATHIPTSAAVVAGIAAAVAIEDLWDRTGSLLSTKNDGDDVTLDALSKLFFDNADDTYIYESSANILDFYAGGNHELTVTNSGIKVNNIDEIDADGGIIVDGLLIKDYGLYAPDGSSSDGASIIVQAGDPNGATNDGGSVTIKAGDAILADSASVPGGIYLNPGNQYSTNMYHTVWLGSSVSTATAFEIGADGTEVNIHIAIAPKGTGQFRTLSATSHLYNSQFVHIGSVATWRVTSSYSLVIHGGDGNIDENGQDVTVRGGAGNGVGDGGNLYLRRGDGGGSGAAGTVYFGTGAAGSLAGRDSETNVVYYDTGTGKLTYGTIAGGFTPGDDILDWTGSAYAPYAAQTTGAFDSGVVNPISAVNRLNYDGEFYAYNLYAANATDHVTITSGGQVLIYTGGANQLVFQPYVSDGAGAYAYMFDTENTLVTEGSRIATFKSNGTERFVVFGQGELMISERSITGLPTPAATQGFIYMDSADDKLYFKNSSTTYDLTQLGESGTVTSVSAGDGMNFSTITTAGSVTMGTPGTLTAATSNAVTATSHTHAITGLPAYGSDNQIPYVNSGGTGFDYSSNFTFNGSLLYIAAATSHAGHVYPSTTSSRSLGTSSLYWTATFTDQVTLKTGIILAYDGSDNMTFVDGVTSSKKLSELAAGGSDTNIQYNNGGAFGGSAKFTFDGNSVTLAQTTAGTNAGLYLTHSDNTNVGSNCIISLNVTGGGTTQIVSYNDAITGTLGGVTKAGGSFIYAGTDSTSLSLVVDGDIPINLSVNGTVTVDVRDDYTRFYAGHDAAGNAWTDYPTSLPLRAVLIQRRSGEYILNDYNSVQIQATGGLGKNAYVTLACQSISATDHKTRFNMLLRGGGSTAYETVFAADYNSIYYWKVHSTASDITHKFVQSTTTQVVMGWDDSMSAFQIHTGTAFQSTTAAADLVITATGYVYLGNIQNSSNTNYLRYNSSTGEVTWLSSSDIRLKEKIKSWNPDSLKFLMKQRLIRFDRKDGSSKGELGWDATQMEKLMPEMTWRDEKGYVNFKDAHFPFHFHRAIQQLGDKVEKLETLEDRVTRLERENVDLREQLAERK